MLRKIPKRCINITCGEIKNIFFSIINNTYKTGPLIAKFEESFKKFTQAKEAIALSSGRFALLLLLKHLGVKKQDKIIISAYNFKGVPQMLLKEGFLPVFVDADLDTCQIKIEDIEAVIDKDTKAIIVTHLFGQVCDLDKIMAIAKRHNLFVIEDCAHALGSFYHTRHVGAIADAGFFSFTGSKMLNTSFGGMLITNNLELAAKIRKDLLNYNFPDLSEILRQRLVTYFYAIYSNKYFYSAIFYPVAVLMNLINLDPLEIYKSLKKKEIAEKKMLFSNLQSEIGLQQMHYLYALTLKRKKIVNNLIKKLDPSISIIKPLLNCDPCYIMFAIKTKNKSEVFRKLIFNGIDTNLSYASDCSDFASNAVAINSKFLSQSILLINLPFDLNENEVEYIAVTLNNIKHLLL